MDQEQLNGSFNGADRTVPRREPFAGMPPEAQRPVWQEEAARAAQRARMEGEPLPAFYIRDGWNAPPSENSGDLNADPADYAEEDLFAEDAAWEPPAADPVWEAPKARAPYPSAAEETPYPSYSAAAQPAYSRLMPDRSAPPPGVTPPQAGDGEGGDKKPKDPLRKKFFIFGAVTLVLCVVCSALTGALSSYLVLRLAPVFSVGESATEENTYVPDLEPVAPVESEAQTDSPLLTESEAPSQDAAPAVTAAPAKTKGEIYKAAVGSIVSVEAKGTQTVQNMFGFGVSQPVTSRGSGFFFTADGYIVTNYHVIEGMDSFSISTYEGQEYEVFVQGYDAANDIAVLKAEGSFTPVTLGSSSALQVGDDVLVIGNALGELSYTFTDGVVSYLSRIVTGESGRAIRMFQTNAAINEGNSGGPVYNMDGEVVGIASAKYASDTIEGLGFCIPIDDVKGKIEDIIQNGYVTDNPLLGVSVQTVNSAMSARYNVPVGCYVVVIEEGTAAARAGVAAGDVIVRADGYTLSSCSDLGAVLSTKKAGQTMELTFSRDGREQTVTVTLDVSRNDPPRTDYSNVFDY